MFQRVRTAAGVLSGNLRKIHVQDFALPSHQFCLFVERPCSALQESPSLESLSSLLDGSTFPQRRSYAVNEAIGPTSSSRMTGPCTRSLFEFCRTAHPDGPFTPVGEFSKDVFPRTAFVPHLGQLYIVVYPRNLALLWLQWCLVYLRMCNSVVADI